MLSKSNMFSEYMSENARWKAYQFQDPYAEGVFVVASKETLQFCTPNCDLKDPVQDRSMVVFYSTFMEALEQGYAPCGHCNPTDVNEARKKLVMMCIDSINSSINFNPPATLFVELYHSDNGSAGSGAAANNSTTNNNMVTIIACRHIAYAAATSHLNQHEAHHDSVPSSPTSPTSPNAAGSNASKKRRKRGGVVGFKELAAKSKLSPWHFHRVFKSITGLTPKAYGDKCSAFIKSFKDQNVDAAAFEGTGSAAAAAVAASRHGSISGPAASAVIPTLESSEKSDLNSAQLMLDPNSSSNFTMGAPLHRHSIITTATSQSFDSQMLDNPNSFSPTELDNMSPISSYLSSHNNNDFFTTPQDTYGMGSAGTDQLLDVGLFDLVKGNDLGSLNNALSPSNIAANPAAPIIANDTAKTAENTSLFSTKAAENTSLFSTNFNNGIPTANPNLAASAIDSFSVDPLTSSENIDFSLYMPDLDSKFDLENVSSFGPLENTNDALLNSLQATSLNDPAGTVNGAATATNFLSQPTVINGGSISNDFVFI